MIPTTMAGIQYPRRFAPWGCSVIDPYELVLQEEISIPETLEDFALVPHEAYR